MSDQDKPKDYDPMETEAERRREEGARWKEQSAEAIRSHNERVEREDLTLKKYWRHRYGGAAPGEPDNLPMRTNNAH
ncbi:hypothetical protein QFZ27_003026 [Inquilinus ginsengisoli]